MNLSRGFIHSSRLTKITIVNAVIVTVPLDCETVERYAPAIERLLSLFCQAQGWAVIFTNTFKRTDSFDRSRVVLMKGGHSGKVRSKLDVTSLIV